MASDSSSNSAPVSLILHGVHSTEKEIGVGAYGRVFEVDYEGTLCAAKEIHALLLQYAKGNDLQKIKDDFHRECQIWSTLRHPCVVQFLGVYYPAMDQYRLPVMVMEKMQHSLRDLVKNYGNIPLNVKLSILDEVCLGLRYLHSRNPPIVHRDLTPNNILLSYRLEAKITDLGVAKVMQTTDTKTMTKAPGTTDFMPPECLADRPVYGVSLDVFSYGGVILYTITQLWPQPSSWVQFDPDTGRRMVLSELERRQRYLDKMTGGAANMKPLVMSCLDDNPKKRPPLTHVSMTIKRAKDECNQKSSCDGMSPIVWWAEVTSEQELQVTSSLTTALEEMTINNEQLRRENDVLKTDITQLRTDNDAMKDEIIQLQGNNDKQKDEIEQLTTLLGKMAVNNQNQIQQINSQSSENEKMEVKIGQLKEENQQVLKKSTTPVDLFSGPVNIKWEEGAPAPVNFYQGHTAVWLNGVVYVGDGSLYSYGIVCYDPVNNSWTSPINTPYSLFTLTTLNNKLLTVSGIDQNSRTNQILIMNDGQLTLYTKMMLSRVAASAASHQGMLIITGGYDGSKKLSATELYDSHNGQWYCCDDLPQPHTMLQPVIVDDTLYLLGGVNESSFGSQTVFTAPLDTLSRHQLKWSVYQDTPLYFSSPVCVNGVSLLIVGGGEDDIINRCSKSVNDPDINKLNRSWEAIGHIPSPRISPVAISTGDNNIIVIGGISKGIPTNTVWIGSCEPQ